MQRYDENLNHCFNIIYFFGSDSSSRNANLYSFVFLMKTSQRLSIFILEQSGSDYGQSMVSLGSVQGLSRVCLRSVPGQSQVFLKISLLIRLYSWSLKNFALLLSFSIVNPSPSPQSPVPTGPESWSLVQTKSKKHKNPIIWTGVEFSPKRYKEKCFLHVVGKKWNSFQPKKVNLFTFLKCH